MKIISTNPSRNYEVISEVEASTLEDIKAKVAAAHKAKKMWRDMGVAGRVSLLRKVGKRLEENAERICS